MGGKSSHSSRKIIETVRLKDYFEVEIMGKPLGSFDLMKGKVGRWVVKQDFHGNFSGRCYVAFFPFSPVNFG